MDYAVKLSPDAAAMTDDDARQLRDLGFSDREIADITMAAAARNFFSRSLLAVAVDLDVRHNHLQRSTRPVGGH